MEKSPRVHPTRQRKVLMPALFHSMLDFQKAEDNSDSDSTDVLEWVLPKAPLFHWCSESGAQRWKPASNDERDMCEEVATLPSKA